MTTVPDEGTSQLNQAQVIGRLLIIAHQYRPALGQPGQSAFYHPPAGGKGFLAPLVQLLLSNAPDMRTVLVSGNRSRRLWDCHTLCPGTGFAPPVAASLLCPPRSASRVSCHGRWPRPPLRSRVRLLRRPGCSSCSRLCPGRWGFVQWSPPKRALPIEQSADCHSQFTPPNSWHSSIRTAQMPPSAPLPTQRWKVRWIVLSSPNSLGK